MEKSKTETPASLRLQTEALEKIALLHAEVDAMMLEAGATKKSDYSILTKENQLKAYRKLKQVDELFLKHCPIPEFIQEIKDTTFIYDVLIEELELELESE